MDKAELRELRVWLTKHIILSWVEQGMTLEEAKQLWREIDTGTPATNLVRIDTRPEEKPEPEQPSQLNEHESWLLMYESFTPEERKQYWAEEKRAMRAAELDLNRSMIETCEELIWYTKQWLIRQRNHFVLGSITEQELKDNMILGAEVIQGNELAIKNANRDIAQLLKQRRGL